MGNTNSSLTLESIHNEDIQNGFVRSMDGCDPDKIPLISVNLKSVNASARNIVIVTTGTTGNVRFWLLSKINVFLFSFSHKFLPVPKSHYLVHQFRGITCLTVHLEPNLFQIMSLFMENVYDYLSREELFEKILAIQTLIDPYLNQYLLPKSTSRVLKTPEIKCLMPIEKGHWANPEIELSSMAPIVSEPSSLKDYSTSFLTGFSEPPSSASSFLPDVGEPASLLREVSSSVAEQISEPSLVGVASSSCMTAISEPRSVESGSSSCISTVSEPEIIMSSSRQRRRASRAASVVTESIFVSEPGSDESEASEVFRTAKEVRYRFINQEDDTCSVSSSLGPRTDRWSSASAAPELELSDYDKEYLSSASERSVDEAVEHFYNNKSSRSGSKKRRLSKINEIVPPSLDEYFPNA